MSYHPLSYKINDELEADIKKAVNETLSKYDGKAIPLQAVVALTCQQLDVEPQTFDAIWNQVRKHILDECEVSIKKYER